MGAIAKINRYLGPENCVLSIVEGRSSDSTLKFSYQVSNSIDALSI
jgi:hypothetical protein